MTVLTLPQRLTHLEAPACFEALRDALAQGTGTGPLQVRVDGAALQQFDSSAVAVLLALRRETLQRGWDFNVLGLSDNFLTLARLYGVAGLVGVKP